MTPAENALLLAPETRRSERMRELFAEHAPRDFAAIERALDGGDPAEIGKAAHRLKGSAYTFGAVRLRDHAAEVERVARDGNMPSERAIEELGAILRATLALLAELPR